MVSPIASDRLGCAWISAADVGRQRLPVHREIPLVQQLAGPRSDQVEAEDRPATRRDDLHQAVGLAEDHRPAVAGERVLVHLDVVAGIARLGLGHAGPGHLRMGVDHPRHLAVVHRRRVLTEDGLHGDHRFGIGDVCESGRVDAVADRVHAGTRGGHRRGVDLDESSV